MNEFELRQRLRELPRDREPGHDLWPGIARRLTPPRRRARPWLGIALAAGLGALAVGVAWQLPNPGPATQTALPPSAAAPSTPLLREADVMIVQYRAALAELSLSPLPLSLRPLADELDAGARELRQAMQQQPDSLQLLHQLRRTYDQRLRLSQRAALG